MRTGKTPEATGRGGTHAGRTMRRVWSQTAPARRTDSTRLQGDKEPRVSCARRARGKLYDFGKQHERLFSPETHSDPRATRQK